LNRKLDLIKGQEVFIKIEKGSNAARRVDLSLDNIDEWVFSGAVVSIGRKYVTVKFKSGIEDKFEIDNDYKQHYAYGGADYKLYTSIQDIKDEKEFEDLYNYIKNEFIGQPDSNKYTLEKLKRIKEIIA
jgi:hypothetical protein